MIQIMINNNSYDSRAQQLRSIQMLRGVAALFVVFFHFTIPLHLDPNTIIGSLVSNGWSGVDMFFVISGFIAAYTVRTSDTGPKQAANYLLKRLIRIIPLYYLVTILSVGSSHETFIESIKSMLFIPIGGEGVDSYGPLYGGARVGQGWTLNYEIFFYIVVALSFFVGRLKWLFINSVMIALILVPFLILPTPENYGIAGFRFSIPYLSMITNPVILEFLLGLVVFYTYKNMDNKLSISWRIVIACSSLFFALNLHNPVFHNSRLMMWGVPSALLAVALLKLERCNKLPDIKWLMLTGNLSFSIYLLHEGVQKNVRKIVKASFGDAALQSMWVQIIAICISLALTYALAKITYKYIEQKQNNNLRRLVLLR